MLRALAVAALIALAVPADARPLPVADEVALPDVPLGNPTLRADPAFWIPILREEGYADAARASAQPEEMAEEEDEEEQVEHWFMPLGDANDNGRDDVILGTLEDDTITYQALDGGRASEVLWTLELGEDEYAYLTGDVDEDGVYDLEQLVDEEFSNDDEYSEWEARATVNILSGRDLAPLTSLQVVSRSTYEETQPEPLPIGESTYRESYTYEYVIDVEGQPGLARLAYNYDYYESEENVVVLTTSSHATLNSSTSYALLDAAGALVWAFDDKGWDIDYSYTDATGDDIPDLLARTNDQYSSSYSNLEPPIDPPVDPPIPIPFLTQEKTARAAYEIQLLDGASGASVWTQSFGNATFSFTSWLGDLYGDGQVLAVYIVDFNEEEYTITETLSFLDGDTGEVVHESSALESFYPLGDANGDGRDDLLQLDFNDSTLSFTAVDGEFNEIWASKIADDDFAGFADMTGDDVVDLLGWKGDNITVFSGTSGEEAWTREESRMAFFDVTPGIVDVEDRELALLLSDAKDHEDLADYPADLLVLRGDDGAPLWRKPLYDPTDYTDVAGDDAFLWMMSAGDLNADGANDFIVEFEQGYTISIHTTCSNDECETEISDSREDDEGQPMNIVALVDGATGATIARYDDMELSGKIKKVTEAPTEVEPAAEDLVEQDAPGSAFFAALAAVGVAFLVRRRKL